MIPIRTPNYAIRTRKSPGLENSSIFAADSPREKWEFSNGVKADDRCFILHTVCEAFRVPPQTQNEYIVATVDVKEQMLKLFLDTIQVEEYKYQLR